MTHEQQLTAAEAAQNVGAYDEAERLAQNVIGKLSQQPRSPEQADDSNNTMLLVRAQLTLADVARLKGDYRQSLAYAKKAEELAAEPHLLESKARAWNIIGIVYWNLSDYVRALEYMGNALDVQEALNNKHGIAGSLANIGVVHWNFSDYVRALDYLNKALALNEELGNKAGMANCSGSIGNVHWSLSDYPRALEYMVKALNLQEELGNKQGVANSFGNIGNVYSNLSDYSRALEYYAKALALDEELGDKAGVAADTGNIGLVYYRLADYAMALEYYGRALAFNEELDNKAGMAIWSGNIGNVHHHLENYSLALEYLGKALSLEEELGNASGVAIWTGSLGNVYACLADYPRALEYMNKAYALQEELGNKAGVAIWLNEIGTVYATEDFEGYDPDKAEERLLKAMAMNEELGTKGQNIDVFKSLAELYKCQRRWEALEYLEKHYKLKEEVQSEEAKKKALLMEQQKQAADREKEIAIARAAAAAKLNATTELLHKVLPEAIATRMIGGETEIADYFPAVSILFADIVGFTPIAVKMPAFLVVRLLNFVFGELDRIIKKHGCEKVKTIGDGYMAAAGAPIECADHACRLAAAALEMLETISLPKEIREQLPEGTTFNLRIGLHTGAVVAGVIGKERFVYDFYSDAVNTAARMESYGEPGKVHASEQFKHSLEAGRCNLGLVFVKRETMDVKGKGMMQTYFLEKG